DRGRNPKIRRRGSYDSYCYGNAFAWYCSGKEPAVDGALCKRGYARLAI
ncbi:uncharacterized protein METZ01_LOCUS464920, partial [marine metagenome]